MKAGIRLVGAVRRRYSRVRIAAKTLPPMTLADDSTLVWTANGGIFQIFEDNLGVPVNSQASHGETFVPAGTYTFQINAIGDWTIEFR